MPSETPTFEVTCFVCDGHNDDCDACAGTRTIRYLRCPNLYMGASERAVCNALAWLESGITPHGGGWADMPAKGLDAINLVAREKVSIGQVEED